MLLRELKKASVVTNRVLLGKFLEYIVIFAPSSKKGAKSQYLNFFQRNIDLVHVFEDRVKLKILSEIYSPWSFILTSKVIC